MTVLSPLAWHRGFAQAVDVQICRTDFFHHWRVDIETDNVAVYLRQQIGEASGQAHARCRVCGATAIGIDATVLNFVVTHKCP